MIYHRKLDKGKWELDIETTERVEQEEVLDDGKGTLREGQQAAKYNKYAAAIINKDLMEGVTKVAPGAASSRAAILSRHDEPPSAAPCGGDCVGASSRPAICLTPTPRPSLPLTSLSPPSSSPSRSSVLSVAAPVASTWSSELPRSTVPGV